MFKRVPANFPIEFMAQDGLPFEMFLEQQSGNVSTPVDLTGYTGVFKVLTKAGATVYESTDVDMNDAGRIAHDITAETIGDWTTCPDRYFVQIVPSVGLPLTVASGTFKPLPA